MTKYDWQVLAVAVIFIFTAIVIFVYAGKTCRIMSPLVFSEIKTEQKSVELPRKPSADPSDWGVIWPALDWRNRRQHPKYYRDSENPKVFYVDNTIIGDYWPVIVDWNGVISKPSRATFLEYIRVTIFPDGKKQEVILDTKKTEWQQAVNNGRLVKIRNLPKLIRETR